MRRNAESRLLHDVLAYLGAQRDVLAYRVQPLRIGRLLSAPPGHPDVLACVRGLSLYIELKSPAGRLSAPQEAFREAVFRGGGVYLLARDLASVQDMVGTLRLLADRRPAFVR